jgi:hypothetical protein
MIDRLLRDYLVTPLGWLASQAAAAALHSARAAGLSLTTARTIRLRPSSLRVLQAQYSVWSSCPKLFDALPCSRVILECSPRVP